MRRENVKNEGGWLLGPKEEGQRGGILERAVYG